MNWKIKTNYSKCKIGYSGISKPTLEKVGGIKVRGNTIEITNQIKILGYTFSNLLNSTHHVMGIKGRAHNQLTRMQNFQCAPIKTKLYLYTALIRPLLEYPCRELSISGLTCIRELQRVPNRALRFVYNNTSISDYITMESAHSK